MFTRYITTSLVFHFILIILILTFGFIQPPVDEKPQLLTLNLQNIPLGSPDAPIDGGGVFRPGPTPGAAATPAPKATEAQPAEVSAPTPAPPPPKPVEQPKPEPKSEPKPEPKAEPPVKKVAGTKEKEVVSKTKEIVEEPDIAIPEADKITPTPTPAGKEPKGDSKESQEGVEKDKKKAEPKLKEKGIKLPDVVAEATAKPSIDVADLPKPVNTPAPAPKVSVTPPPPAVSTPAVRGAGGLGISELGGTGTGGVDGPGAGTNPGGIPGARRGLANGDPNGGWSLGQNYAQQALFFIEQNFKPPYSMPGVKTIVAFRILKDGMIDPNSIRVVTGSGKGDLDQSGVGAIRKTAKLPPLYEGFDKMFMDVAVTFEFDKK